LSTAEIISLAVGTLTGILTSSAFILALFLGFCIIAGFPKLRPTFGRKSMVVRSLDDLVGQESFARYLPPSAPRGPLDVLHTYEQRGNSVK
jgi:hypothetical protein